MTTCTDLQLRRVCDEDDDIPTARFGCPSTVAIFPFPLDGRFPWLATLASGVATVASRSWRVGRARVVLAVLLIEDVGPQEKLVGRRKAEGRVDLLSLMDLAATVDRERPSDGRAIVLVARPIRLLALAAAIMGAPARAAILEPRLPLTVARRSSGMAPWEDDGGDAPAPRVPAAHADGHPQRLGLLELHVANGGAMGARQIKHFALHQRAHVRGEILVREEAAVEEVTDVEAPVVDGVTFDGRRRGARVEHAFVHGCKPRTAHVALRWEGAERSEVLWDRDGHGRQRTGDEGRGGVRELSRNELRMWC